MEILYIALIIAPLVVAGYYFLAKPRTTKNEHKK